jgi:hypothetical protein
VNKSEINEEFLQNKFCTGVQAPVEAFFIVKEVFRKMGI